MKKVIVEIPITDEERREQLMYDRMTFACLFEILMQGGQEGIQDFLKDKSEEDRHEYARIWDECSAAPISVVVNRPNFEGK